MESSFLDLHPFKHACLKCENQCVFVSLFLVCEANRIVLIYHILYILCMCVDECLYLNKSLNDICSSYRAAVSSIGALGKMV